MSSISSVASVANPYPAAGQGKLGQAVKNFQAIGSALQAGNLSNAQSALASFQKSLPGSSPTSSSQPFGQNGQANTDYQMLTSAVKSGKLANAQQAYASLQADLTGSQSTQRSHHHHGTTTSAGKGGSLNVTA